MQEYRNDKLVVRYDRAICIHAGECVHGLPSVFNVSKKPWIVEEVSGWSIPSAAACPIEIDGSDPTDYQPLPRAA